MPAPIFIVNADYTVIDRSPLVLNPGDVVTLGPTDRVWQGWISVTTSTSDGRSTYVPEKSLKIGGDGTATMLTRFDATDLSVRKGDTIVSLQETHGWHWARKQDGSEGWVPGYLLEMS